MKFLGKSFVIPALLVLFAGALYLPRLEDAPPYLTPDELFSGLSAHAIATTGRDLNGRLLPLYFQLSPQFVTRMWYQPIVIYAIALSVKVLPFSEGSIRLPMALAAIVDIVLLYYVARRIFRSDWYAAAAAVLLAVTPAHFINIRVAMDHYACLPFLLGWLLCLLVYLERNRPSLLFAAGLFLGVGLYTYIASYLLMPAYLAVTALVLFWRREPMSRYAVLAAGFLIPASICVPYLLTHSVIRDTLWRYDRQESQTAATAAIAKGMFNYQRLASAGSLYWTFWNPRFLFIDGPRSRWPIGAFLLPVCGLCLAGIVRAIRRPDAWTLVLMAAAITAPIPATAVGEPEEIRRAAAMLPAVVLLAIAGLAYVRTAETPFVERILAVIVWGTLIVLTAMFRDTLPRGQALVRAASVPLAVLGLATVMDPRTLHRGALLRAAVAGVATLIVMNLVYVGANYGTLVGSALLAAISIATVLTPRPARATGTPWLLITLLPLLIGHFLFVYVDYAQLHRLGAVPASAIILGVRVTLAAVALAAVIVAARFMSRSVAERISAGRLVAVASIGIVAAQLAYFSVDAFTDFRLRFIHATVVLVVVAGVAALIRHADATRLKTAHIVTAGLVGIVALQFTIFYADYFNGFRARGSADRDGNERIVFETVIEQARERSVPAVYLGWPDALANLYWQFYLTKHHREDLLVRTVPALEFNVDRIRALPSGSVVITRPSRDVDAAIRTMTASGELVPRSLLNAPDGTPAFWILDTGAGARVF